MTKSIIYFTAAKQPTATEVLETAALVARSVAGYEVKVRAGSESNSYGAGIESADLVAGTIPTEYAAYDEYGDVHADRPVKLDVFGPAGVVSVAAEGTLQLGAYRVDGVDVSDLSVSDLYDAGDGIAWSSDDEGVATIAATGVVTGVGAGTCEITATLTFASGKTMTAVIDITITA